MRIVFKLFAGLGEFLPPATRKSSRVELEVPAGSTVLQVILNQGVPPERCSLVLVNGVFVALHDRESHRLEDGDVLANCCGCSPRRWAAASTGWGTPSSKATPSGVGACA